MTDDACIAHEDNDEASRSRASRRARIVRPRTENIHRISRRRLTLLGMDAPVEDVERPRTRGDCEAVPRPCPFVGCRHSLYLEVNPTNGSIKHRFPDLDPDEMPPGRSCVLDVADRGPATLQEVGDSMNMVRERVRQIQTEAAAKIADAYPKLRAMVGAGLDEDDEAGANAPEDEEDAMSEKKDRTLGPEVELDLPCALTDTEVLGKADLVAKLHDEAAALRGKKKAASEEIGGEIKGKEGAISALVGQIRTRTETRAVKCRDEFDFKSGVVQTRRLDTKDVVATRTMTAAERQPTLFEIPGGKADPPAAAKPGPRKGKPGRKPKLAAVPSPEPVNAE